jgi:ribosomal protein S18 acetylase RimI-like enzyme
MATLRPYRVEDQDAVVAIWWDAWHSIRPGLRHPRPYADWRRRWIDEIVPAQTIAVADDAGTVVGFAAADEALRELTQIFVAPHRHRRGIGRQLLGWAQDVMPAGFTLHTLVDNLASRAFYHRHGLVEGGRRTNPVNGLETLEYRWRPPPA